MLFHHIQLSFRGLLPPAHLSSPESIASFQWHKGNFKLLLSPFFQPLLLISCQLGKTPSPPWSGTRAMHQCWLCRALTIRCDIDIFLFSFSPSPLLHAAPISWVCAHYWAYFCVFILCESRHVCYFPSPLSLSSVSFFKIIIQRWLYGILLLRQIAPALPHPMFLRSFYSFIKWDDGFGFAFGFFCSLLLPLPPFFFFFFFFFTSDLMRYLLLRRVNQISKRHTGTVKFRAWLCPPQNQASMSSRASVCKFLSLYIESLCITTHTLT